VNPEISKSARELLAKQPAAESHPSADLLNAYVEQSLSAPETSQVLAHLSSCVGCREVVFLASNAVEEEMQPELLVAAAKAGSALTPRPAAMPATDARVAEKVAPKPNWNWWRWAAPLAAVVIVGAAVLIERGRMTEMLSPTAYPAASTSRETAAPASSEAKATPPPMATDSQRDANALVLNSAPNQLETLDRASPRPKKAESTERAQAAAQQQALQKRMLEAQLASNLEVSKSNSLVTSEAKPKASPPASSSTAVEVTSAAPLVQADSADLAAPDALKAESLAKSSLMANNQPAGLVAAAPMQRHLAGNTHWRVTSDGHVEHSTIQGTWTRTLGSQPATFRVVATIGNDVWTGGGNGALFHTSDNGETWNKVTVSANGQSENGAIVSIHFNTAQQGSVISDSGATWTTTDGGQSWTKQ
jgi:hypothetical protein